MTPDSTVVLAQVSESLNLDQQVNTVCLGDLEDVDLSGCTISGATHSTYSHNLRVIIEGKYMKTTSRTLTIFIEGCKDQEDRDAGRFCLNLSDDEDNKIFEDPINWSGED